MARVCASFSLLSTIAKMSAARSSFVQWCHWSSVERQNTASSSKIMIHGNLLPTVQAIRRVTQAHDLKPCSNGKCLVTIRNQTLLGDQTWPNNKKHVWSLSNLPKCLTLYDQMLSTFKFYKIRSHRCPETFLVTKLSLILFNSWPSIFHFVRA